MGLDLVSFNPGLDNPRGYFESRQLVEFNDGLLALAGGDWCHPPLLPPQWNDQLFFSYIEQYRADFTSYSLSKRWIDKDPRLSITLPAFGHLLLRRVPVIVALRAPLAVATSLHLRNGFPLEVGLGLWFLYNHHLARHLGLQDQVVPYDIILKAVDPQQSQSLIELLQKFLSVNAEPTLPIERWQEIFSSRIDLDLCRASTATLNANGVQQNLLMLLDESYHAARSGVDGFCTAFSSLPTAVLDLLARHSIVASPGLHRSFHECQQLYSQIDALHKSRSWRMTAPFRWLSSRWG